ncbi:MAG: tRNA pseudouridine(13) synthase TruD [Fuerstiella sp.]
MKLKCVPEDFQVSELTDRRPSTGSYSLYRLRKTSIGTPETLQLIGRNWNLSPRQISHGGLKDRHAVTTQFITIRRGPQTDLEHDRFQLQYLGPTESAYGAADITGNRFEIVLRSLSADVSRTVQARQAIVGSRGFPNYFDEQRFGSLGASGEFVAAKWCLKDYERALWLALADHNRHDDAAERRQKQVLRDQWGHWDDCKQQLERSHRRSIVTYLMDHPTKFRKAFGLLNENLRGLYLSAFQSAVWNRMLSDVLQRAESETGATWHRMKIGDAQLPFPAGDDTVSEIVGELPLPSSRCRGLTAEQRALCDAALQPYQMTLDQMKLSYPRDRWFSRGLRATTTVPHELHVRLQDDDRYAGRQKATLSFELPRGCYATMLVKALTGDGMAAADDEFAGDEFEVPEGDA